MTPITPDPFIDSHASHTYLSFLIECEKQNSAFGDNDVFEYPQGTGNTIPGNIRPNGLTAYVFNWKYDEATLRGHYCQSATSVKDWLHDTYMRYRQTFDTLLSNVPHRPLASSTHHSRLSRAALVDDDSAMKDVLGLLSKYQFQYRRPCRFNQEAAVDEWHARTAEEYPEHLATDAFHVPRGDFNDSISMCPGDLMQLDRSAIGGDKVCSMLCHSVDQWWSRKVVGVSFPLYLWVFHGVDAMSIETSWLELPLIRIGKRPRGTNAGRKLRANTNVGHGRQSNGNGHWRHATGQWGNGSSKGWYDTDRWQ